jgi:hypothetical protein
VLDFLRKGDVLMVTRIDRLARSIGDLQDVVRAVRAKGASLKATEQPIHTSTAAGKCFLDMLGVFADAGHLDLGSADQIPVKVNSWRRSGGPRLLIS